MQPAAQVAIVAGGAFITYLMAQITPTPQRVPLQTEEMKTTDGIEEISMDEPIESIETEPYCPWRLTSAKGDDFEIIQLITEESLAYQLENSTEIAKKTALEIGKFGFPSYSNLRFYDSYCSSINYLHGSPNWSGEVISKYDLEPNESVDRCNCPGFHEDESVPKPFRSKLSDYKRSGLSRGHLVPAGDHNACQFNKDLTFKLSANIVPQDLSMNGTDWLRVERFVKKLVISKETDIQKCWIFSGPVFKPKFKSNDGECMYCKPITVKKKYGEDEEDKGEIEEILKVFNAPNTATDGRLKGKMEYKTIGPTMIHVPTHLFKVILAERGGDINHDHDDDDNNDINKYQLAAFMVQNEPIHDILPLTHYLIDIDELEKYVGLQFFPKLRCNDNDENYGELYLNYKCEYEDDERCHGWRRLNIIQTAKDFDELENIWNDSCEHGFEKDWMKGMFKRAYFYRKKDLIRPIQKQINYMRQFE